MDIAKHSGLYCENQSVRLLLTIEALLRVLWKNGITKPVSLKGFVLHTSLNASRMYVSYDNWQEVSHHLSQSIRFYLAKFELPIIKLLQQLCFLFWRTLSIVKKKQERCSYWLKVTRYSITGTVEKVTCYLEVNFLKSFYYILLVSEN